MRKIESNSWFDVESDYNRNYTFTQTSEKYVKCRRIKLYCSKKQKDILNSWLNSYTYTYNVAIRSIRRNNGVVPSFINLRKSLKSMLENNSIIKKTSIPVHIRDRAIFEVISAYKTCFSNMRAKNINHFRLRYRKYTKPTLHMKIEGSYFSKKKNGFCITKLGEMKTSSSIIGVNKESTLVRRDNNFYLMVPFECFKIENKNINETCGIDPGIRTFLSIHSDQEDIKIGSNSYGFITKDLNMLNSKKSILKGTKLKKVESRINTRIRNRVEDMHWKSIHLITNRFKTIKMGNMSTKSIVQSTNLNKRVKDVAYKLSFFRFRQKLEYVCQYKNLNLIHVNEYNTTKTCSSCKSLNHKVGSSETFNCEQCGLCTDRDLNAAKNILLK